ncbi:MAG: type II toxin-antitoxin system RelE/ParE family toxin [Spirochaetaceae bacterium]|jgi:hypothetical protein|nr:type II toxin-antitoxin system RelE/ParE family toxin [Spirochaetaceae bacterium]
MRIFKSKWFVRFARKNGLDDAALRAAAEEIEAGNFDADLGGRVYKQRIARGGQGKRGGYRTIVLFKRGERAFFMYGFAKNKRDTITNDEVDFYKAFAKKWLAYSEAEIKAAVEAGAFLEVEE